MIPSTGQTVVVIFRTGIQIEGEVVSWTDDKSVIKSPSGSTTIVIQKTLDDILFYKISSPKTEYEKLKNKPQKDEADIKTIAALKNELNEIELAEIKDKLITHTADNIKQVSYELPKFNSQIKSTVKYTGKEIAREGSDFSSELQSLFGKKC